MKCSGAAGTLSARQPSVATAKSPPVAARLAVLPRTTSYAATPGSAAQSSQSFVTVSAIRALDGWPQISTSSTFQPEVPTASARSTA